MFIVLAGNITGRDYVLSRLQMKLANMILVLLQDVPRHKIQFSEPMQGIKIPIVQYYTEKPQSNFVRLEQVGRLNHYMYIFIGTYHVS